MNMLVVPVLFYLISFTRSITVTGPLVDLYCWYTNGMKALDTGDNLRIAPYNHTLFCLVEVYLYLYVQIGYIHIIYIQYTYYMI